MVASWMGMLGVIRGPVVAQNSGGDLGDILYLVLFLVLPALSGLGQWIRKRSRKNEVELDVDEILVEVEDPHPVPDARPIAVPAPVRRAEARPSAPQLSEPIHVEPPRPQPARPLPARPTVRPAHPATAGPQVPERARATPRPVARPQPPRARPRPQGAPPRTVQPGVYQPQVSSTPDTIEPPSAPSLGDSLSAIVADPASLRRAVVLAEVLGPPLALRSPGQGPFAPRVDES